MYRMSFQNNIFLAWTLNGVICMRLVKMLRKLSDKQFATPMVLHVFEKCNPNEQFPENFTQPITNIAEYTEDTNTKFTVGGLYTTNSDSFHNLLTLYRNQIDY